MTEIIIKLSTGREIVPLYQHKEDIDVLGKVRSCASSGCPAVFPLHEPRSKVRLTKDWQYYLIAINYNMLLENVFLLLDDHLAFCNNGTGFDNLDNPGKIDYFFNRLKYTEYPRFDKDRTCSRNMLTGEVDGTNLIVKTMDGNNPPPLKPGRKYPQSIPEINIDDYLYNPREHRHLFVVANMVSIRKNNNSSVWPFPRGATYNWTGDGLPYSFLPLVSNETVSYPLQYLKKVNEVQSPYRIVPVNG